MIFRFFFTSHLECAACAYAQNVEKKDTQTHTLIDTKELNKKEDPKIMHK